MKKILISVAIIAIAAVAAFNVNFYSQENSLAKIGLANVEALADGESVSGETCYNTITTLESSWILYCGTCTYLKNSTKTLTSGKGTC